MNLYATTLAELDKGQLLERLSEDLMKAIAAVKLHGGKASLRLDLKIARISDEAVEIVPEPAIKIPVKPLRRSIYFADDDGNLSKTRFEQKELTFELKTLEANQEPSTGHKT